jgi:hypothetical protein
MPAANQSSHGMQTSDNNTMIPVFVDIVISGYVWRLLDAQGNK